MRSKFIFLLAIIMGVVTTVLFVQYMDKSQVVETSQPVKTIPIVRAVEPIPENSVILSEMLEVVEVPEENIHPKAVDELERVVGKFAVDPIEEGEIILSHRIKDQKDESEFVSRKIKEGYRAVSIGATIDQSVTNLIEPEEYVDVIYTPHPEYAKGERVAEIILSNVRVLAIGRRMITPSDEPYVEYAQVTLELIPNDTVKLITGYETGKLHLTLHPTIKAKDAEDKQ
jgi:pilus assembly protein CpaB